MKKLTISEEKKNEIIKEIKRSDESKYDHRLHGLLLVANGMSPYKASEIMGDSPKSIENWVNKFLKEGFNRLKEPAKQGRPPRLSNIMDNIAEDLRRNPVEFGHSQNLWDGKLLSHHIKVKYGINLGTRQCQRIFRKLGFRLRKPRPEIAKGNPEDKRNFKKK